MYDVSSPLSMATGSMFSIYVQLVKGCFSRYTRKVDTEEESSGDSQLTVTVFPDVDSALIPVTTFFVD